MKWNLHKTDYATNPARHIRDSDTRAWVATVAEAHAALLVGAPDLLAACKRVCAWYESASTETAIERGPFVQARAAIAKATIDPDNHATLSATADAIIESGDLEGGA